jgi:RNA polymerase sigma factor (sigma-70 family)
MVGDHGRAEDITQEIFIAALRRMRETDRPIAFKPWIHEIAKNACIDSFRRSRRAQEVSLDADDGLSSADRGRLTVVTTPDAALDGKQALQHLRGAFGGLSESHHEVLVLRELEGRSYRDIGERLGMSLPVVESTLFRARRRLAEEYDELASGRRCEFVRTMVDSGPHYSLGIRDRRRIARHLAHCQTCRNHARRAGFDESILNMPSVAAKIAAVVPIAFLRLRWGALLGDRRGRPSLLALRSVHTLARNSDQLVGAGSGAGKTAAAAAALVLASVGGGIATENSSPPATPSHRAAPPASIYVAPAATAHLGEATARTAASTTPARARSKLLPAVPARTRRSSLSVAASDPAKEVAAEHRAAALSSPTSPAPVLSGPPTTDGNADASDGGAKGGVDGSGATAPAGTGGSGAPPTTAAPGQTGAPAVPVSPVSTPSLSGVVAGVTGAVPPVATDGGATAGTTVVAPVAGVLGAVASGLAQLVGHH